MSLSEISEKLSVSKAIVGRTINITKNKLENLENTLHLKEISDLIISSCNKKLIDKFNEIIYK